MSQVIDEFAYEQIKRFHTEKGSFPSMDELRIAVQEAHEKLYAGKVLYHTHPSYSIMQYALVSKAQHQKLQVLPSDTIVCIISGKHRCIHFFNTTTNGSIIHEIIHGGGYYDVSATMKALADKS